jgi:hypothetical protein
MMTSKGLDRNAPGLNIFIGTEPAARLPATSLT